MHRPSTTSAHATVVATSPINNSGDNGTPQRNSYARVVGSACAGVSELLLFHPVDTVAKRLMSNQTVSVKGQPTAEAMAALNQVRAREKKGRNMLLHMVRCKTASLTFRVCTPRMARHVFAHRRLRRALGEKLVAE